MAKWTSLNEEEHEIPAPYCEHQVMEVTCEMDGRYYTILNPKTGKKESTNIYEQIDADLKRRGIDTSTDVVIAEAEKLDDELTKKFIEDHGIKLIIDPDALFGDPKFMTPEEWDRACNSGTEPAPDKDEED